MLTSFEMIEILTETRILNRYYEILLSKKKKCFIEIYLSHINHNKCR